jgi:hypothetical protein
MTPRTNLVVEDEYYLADDCATCVREAGFDVAGSYDAIEDVPEITGVRGVVLDINLRAVKILRMQIAA